MKTFKQLREGILDQLKDKLKKKNEFERAKDKKMNEPKIKELEADANAMRK